MAISLAMGLGVVFRPEILAGFPDFIKQIFGSAITTGGLTAIFLNVVLPDSLREQKIGSSHDPLSAKH